MKKLKYYVFDLLLFALMIILLTFQPWFIFIYMLVYLIYLIVIWRFKRNTVELSGFESTSNVLKSGFRRRGKDLSTQASIITLYRKKHLKTLKKVIKQYEKEMPLDFVPIERLNEVLAYLEKYDIKKNINEYAYYYLNPNYLSNVDYGYGCRLVSLDEFRLYKDEKHTKELTFNDFITSKDKIHMNKVKEFEGKNLYLSDGQIELPSYYQSLLLKYYPSFPIFMSLAGHLYHMVIINNSQVMGQLWDKLRNQQDLYVRALDTYPRFKSLFSKIYKYIPIFRKYIFVKLRYYELYQSAEQGLLPFKSGLGIKDRAMIKQMQKEYESMHGKITEKMILVKRNQIKYDTRYYHKVVFGYPFE